MIQRQKKLGEILVKKGLITEEQLGASLTIQQQTKEFVGKILVRRGYIKEKDLLWALSDQFNIPVVSLQHQYVDMSLLKEFSTSLIVDHKCFPIKKDGRSVTMAITNPLDVWALKKAEDETRGLKLKLALVSEDDIKEVIKRYQQYMLGNISRMFE